MNMQESRFWRRQIAFFTTFVACCVSTLQVQAASPANQHDNDMLPKYSLGPKLTIPLDKHDPPTAEVIAKIETLISNLSQIDSPDVGYSPTTSGQSFLPLPGQVSTGPRLLTDHDLKVSTDLKALVETGPDALPYLLDALDDKTPTNLTIHSFPMGAIFFSSEVDWNPVNDREKAVFGERKPEAAGNKKEPAGTYTVRVGDICFVAIGQIVGRPYQAVRYQPSGQIVVNSPVEEPEICQQLRQTWTSRDPRQMLFDSLATDYATRAAFNGKSLDGWDEGSKKQIAAAMRLVYYFPKQAAIPIAERLGKLDVRLTREMKQDVDNGVRAKEFIDAVCASPEPSIRQAIRGIFDRTDDADIAVAALPAVDDRTIAKKRLEAFLKSGAAEQFSCCNGDYGVLAAAYKVMGDDAEPLFESVLNGGNAKRACDTASALENIGGKWSDDLLLKLLVDKRSPHHLMHPVTSAKDSQYIDDRVCDEAAKSLNAHHPELKFEMIGTNEQVDTQIQAIQTRLAKP